MSFIYLFGQSLMSRESFRGMILNFKIPASFSNSIILLTSNLISLQLEIISFMILMTLHLLTLFMQVGTQSLAFTSSTGTAVAVEVLKQQMNSSLPRLRVTLEHLLHSEKCEESFADESDNPNKNPHKDAVRKISVQRKVLGRRICQRTIRENIDMVKRKYPHNY